MEMRAGAALSEQQVERFGRLVLTPAIKRREHLPEPHGEPLQAGGLADVELGSPCPGFPQGSLRTCSDVLRVGR